MPLGIIFLHFSWLLPEKSRQNLLRKVEGGNVTRRYSNNFECVHASQITRCQGQTGADESKRAVKKRDGIGGYGECQERIEKSECGIKLGEKIGLLYEW